RLPAGDPGQLRQGDPLRPAQPAGLQAHPGRPHRPASVQPRVQAEGLLDGRQVVGRQSREDQRPLVAVPPAEGVRAGAEVVLRELTRTFGSVVAVQDVTVTIEPGSFFTLLGPSGSGKTTTLMMVAGFVAPTRGEIRIDGVSVAALPPQKRDLGM